MAALTDDEQRIVLDAIRAGANRAEAARLIGQSGSRLRTMCNPNSNTYDPDFEQAYLAAIADAPPKPPGWANGPKADTPTKTADGYTRADHLTETDLEAFLEHVAGGMPRDKAAREIGTSMVQINRRANRNPDFAEALAAAYENGYPHYQDWLRAKVVDFINDGNYNALRDQVLIHLPEADKLRTSKHEVSGPGGEPIRVLKAVLHGLPSELLAQVIEAVESGDEQEAIKMLNAGEAA